MDFLKKAAEGVSGNKEHTQQNPAAGGSAAPAQQKDYGDKGEYSELPSSSSSPR